jgi:hypothetical protein
MKIQSFEQFLEQVPDGIAEQFVKTRQMIERLVPKAKLEIKYNTPFFTYKGLFIYFSFYKKKNYVVGFCQGTRMEDELKVLKADSGQSQVRHWVLDSETTLDIDLLGAYIIEAEEIQRNHKVFSKRKDN